MIGIEINGPLMVIFHGSIKNYEKGRNDAEMMIWSFCHSDVQHTVYWKIIHNINQQCQC